MSAKTVVPKSEESLRNWKEEAAEIVKFHNLKQAEFGISKSGRPDSVTGKTGWGIRDTAKALKRPFWQVQFALRVAETTPNLIKPSKSSRLEDLLKTIRTTIFILESDKRTAKLGNELKKALKDYES